MTPSRRDSLEDARRKLDEAAGALDDMRRLTGGSGNPGTPILSASDGVKREALAAARDDLRRMAADLETARAQGAALTDEVRRLREELAARPSERELADARASSESSANRRAAELAQQVIGLKERVSLLSAEHVRLEALRRKAEAFGADSEASRRSLEETMRRDLRAAHASLDRAAAESGTRDAKAVTEIEEMRKRLDHALNRLQLEEREKLSRKQASAEGSSFRSDLETAQAVIVSLRRELSEQRADALGRESALELRAHELDRRLTQALSPGGAELVAEVSRLREELALRPTARELEEARAAASSLRRDLNAATASLEELERLREELAARPTALALAEARASEEALKRDLRGALATLEEVVRLREQLALRPTASELKEALAAGETLRRDLQAAKEALVRAAAESAKSEAKAAAEIEELRRRHDREDISKAGADAAGSALRDDVLAAQGVTASLRRELSEQRAGALDRERALERALEDIKRASADAAESAFKLDVEAARGVIASLRRELAEQREGALSRERALELRVYELERRPPEAHFPPSPPAVIDHDEAAGENAGVEYPAMEYALEPGWARLLRLVKPPLQAAYGHLRRLSAGPMSAGQRAILRLTGSSLSQAADSLATIELALADSPATTETTPLLPALESALSAWDAVFRRRGIALTREVSLDMPAAPHDPEQLRLALHHVLRNAVEALPRGAALRVRFGRNAAGAVEIEFHDDGPGYPPAWLARQFEPFASPRQGHAGLGLAAVRRALRRWGGEASVSAGHGNGARLTLTFAPAVTRPESKP